MKKSIYIAYLKAMLTAIIDRKVKAINQAY